MTTARPPSKPWRVEWPSVVNGKPNSEDYSSQRKAYDAVASITGLRVKATVYKWIGGTWVLYEQCEPVYTQTFGWVVNREHGEPLARTQTRATTEPEN